MIEATWELEVPLVISGVQDEQDRCLSRLEEAMRRRKGITRVHLERGRLVPTLCFHYDQALVSIQDVSRMAKHAGATIANHYHHELLHVEGMDCSDCALVIEHSLGRMPGMVAVSVSYTSQTMRVEYESRKVSAGAIEQRLRSLGYSIPAEGLRSWYQQNREVLFSLAAGALLAIGWAGAQFFALPYALSAACYAGAYLLGGWDVARHTLHALRERQFDTDLLMVMAALGAALLGDFAEGALLLCLFSLGHALEEHALGRARAAVRALAELAPKTALVRRDGVERELPVEQLRLADLVIVRPGVRVPVDGEITSGQTAVDQSPVTGESIPVDKSAGDKVFAGSVNGEGALEVRVTRLAKDSTLARVMQMVEEAQTHKSPTQRVMERFSAVFVPVVLAGDALLILVPPLFGVPFEVSFLRAMTVLVAASPCALALGTPATILSGIAQAARSGILIKGGAQLENLGRVRAVAFDKTGTLTRGQPEVTGIITLPGPERSQWDAGRILALAAAVESRSAHPLAQAVVRAAHANNLTLPEVDGVTALTGRGLRATWQDQTVWVGSATLMGESGVRISETERQQIEAQRAEGKTVMLLALNQQPIGLLALADTLRREAAQTMRALSDAGIRATVMLTGDSLPVATAIARQAGLSGFRAELMPEDKLKVIQELGADFGAVAMVGDGVNDAPALAQATIGIAMGGAGTAVALETADVALMGDDLSRLPFAIGLGAATRAIIRQNLVIALGVIGLLSIWSVLGLASIGVAVVLHEGSTLVVVANALRLLTYQTPAGGR